MIVVSAADPLNLAGIVTSGDRVRAAGKHRVAYKDGVPLAVLEGDDIRELTPLDPDGRSEVWTALRRRRAPALSG